jgi:hypothetical protein
MVNSTFGSVSIGLFGYWDVKRPSRASLDRWERSSSAFLLVQASDQKKLYTACAGASSHHALQSSKHKLSVVNVTPWAWTPPANQPIM